MAKSVKKDESFISSFLKPFSYIAIGFITVIKGLINLFIYMCEGSYYTLNCLIINPFKVVGDLILGIKDGLTPRQVKKEKELKIDVNFDEKGELGKKTASVSPGVIPKIQAQNLDPAVALASGVLNSTSQVASAGTNNAQPAVKPLKSTMSANKTSMVKMVGGDSNMNNDNTVKPSTGIGEKKDIYTQMKQNQKTINVPNKKEQKKVNAKQKEKLNAERDSLLKMITDGQEKRLDKPQTFRYKAMTPDGKIETSTFVGVSKLDIYTFLTGEGYTVFSIETSS